MSSNILEADSSFEFEKIHLGKPVPIQGGSFYSAIVFSNNDNPVYIQTPTCSTKEGVKQSSNKLYVDFLLTANNVQFITWLNTLEETVQQLIFQNREEWFADQLELDDIQSHFSSSVKVYKGTNYLVRAFINSGKNRIKTAPIPIFSETEQPKTYEDVKNSDGVVGIIEIQGIKFNQTTFQLVIAIKQIMLIEKKLSFEKCLIKKKNLENNELRNNENTISIKNEEEQDNLKQEKDDINKEENKIENKKSLDEKKETKIESKGKNNLGDINLENLEELNPNSIEEIEITDIQNNENIELKQPRDIYNNLYLDARKKMKKAQKEALDAYLNLKNIKNQYNINLPDSEEEEEYDEEEDQELEEA